MANEIIKSEAKNAGVYLWQVADMMGINPSKLSIILRHELPDTEKQRIRKIIKTLEDEKQVKPSW